MSNVHKQISTLFQAAHEQSKAIEKLSALLTQQAEPLRNMALVAAVLQEKGIVTNAELTEMLAKLRAQHKAAQSTDGKVPSELPSAGADAGDSGNGNGGIPEGQGGSGVPAESTDRPTEDNPGDSTVAPVAP